MKITENIEWFIKENFPALTHKNFRYYWIGQCVSLIGTWTQNIGQSWLVLSITGSPFLLGLLTAVQFLPILIFSLFAGVVVDKYPKKKILLVTQTISMVLAFTLAILIFTHNTRYIYILILAFILGLANTIDMPARQSFTIELAGKEDLLNAIALNSAIFNLARILGPAIGALLMAYLGAGWCFLINGISFIAVIYGLTNIKTSNFVRERLSDKNIFAEIKDGLIYIYKNTTLLKPILMVTVIGIFAFNYAVLAPVLTKAVFHRQEKSYGFLMSALGVGSLFGALTVSVINKSGPKKKMLFISCSVISVMLFLVGLSNSFYLTALLFVITGIFNMYFSITANSTLQINSSNEFRGRVMSVYSLVFAGVAPIGSMLAGVTSEKLGVQAAFSLSGVSIFILVLIINATFILRKKKNILNS
jgi:MFS family permease